MLYSCTHMATVDVKGVNHGQLRKPFISRTFARILECSCSRVVVDEISDSFVIESHFPALWQRIFLHGVSTTITTNRSQFVCSSLNSFLFHMRLQQNYEMPLSTKKWNSKKFETSLAILTRYSTVTDRQTHIQSDLISTLCTTQLCYVKLSIHLLAGIFPLRGPAVVVQEIRPSCWVQSSL